MFNSIFRNDKLNETGGEKQKKSFEKFNLSNKNLNSFSSEEYDEEVA